MSCSITHFFMRITKELYDRLVFHHVIECRYISLVILRLTSCDSSKARLGSRLFRSCGLSLHQAWTPTFLCKFAHMYFFPSRFKCNLSVSMNSGFIINGGTNKQKQLRSLLNWSASSSVVLFVWKQGRILISANS